MKEKNKLIPVEYQEILHNGEGHDAFQLLLPNGVKDWYSKNACKLDEESKKLLIPKWMYLARKKEGRWEPKSQEENEIYVEIENELKIEEMITNEEVTNNNTDDKLTPEQIIKAIVPPTRKRTLKGKIIKVSSKSNRILFSQAQMFDFGFPKTMAFSFTDGHVFCIPNPNIEGLNHHELKAYGKTSSHIIQNQGLIDDIMTFLQIPAEKETFFLESKIYSATGNNLRIFEIKVVNK